MGASRTSSMTSASSKTPSISTNFSRVSRQYDTFLSVGVKKNQKIPYVNEENYERTLLVKSSDPQLLRIRNEKVEFGPGESGKLSLQFVEHDFEEERIFYVDVLDEETLDHIERVQINAS